MLRKEKRTFELYMKAGAVMRLYKTLGSRLIVEISKVLSASDQNILIRDIRRIDRFCSRAEENMFYDYPQLSNTYLDVFYGATDMEPGNDGDKRILEIAKDVADSIVWKSKDPC